MNKDARAIERLRELRQRRGQERSQRREPAAIEAIVGAVRSNAERSHRKLGNLIDVWEAMVPEHLAGNTRVMALRAGTAHIAVTDNAVAFELDRELRSGLEAAIRAQVRATLVRVKIRVSKGDVLGEGDTR